MVMPAQTFNDVVNDKVIRVNSQFVGKRPRLSLSSFQDIGVSIVNNITITRNVDIQFITSNMREIPETIRSKVRLSTLITRYKSL